MGPESSVVDRLWNFTRESLLWAEGVLGKLLAGGSLSSSSILTGKLGLKSGEVQGSNRIKVQV